MGLSLNAEQKSLLNIFKIEAQYIIPAYQRPYSWEYEHCFQLYNDFFEALNSNEDYFIGNIIIAKSEKTDDILEIVDGQQRLLTLLLLIKAFSLLLPKLKILTQILEQEDWEGDKTIPRIKSNIFEADDNHHLQKVLAYTQEQLSERLQACQDRKGNIVEKKCDSRFESNILYFYNWLLFYKSHHSDSLKYFIEFLICPVVFSTNVSKLWL